MAAVNAAAKAAKAVASKAGAGAAAGAAAGASSRAAAAAAGVASGAPKALAVEPPPLGAAAPYQRRNPPDLRRPPPMVPNPDFNYGLLMPERALPERASLPSEPRMFNKKVRLHPYWKLHPKRKWADFAPFITKVVFTYDPSTEGSVGVRELHRQASGRSMRARFSKCEIDRLVVDDGREASVVVTWANGSSQSAPAQWCDFEDILDKLETTRQRLQWAEEDKDFA